MRVAIRSIIISALLGGGTAFAGQTWDSDLTQGQQESRLAFINQETNRTVVSRPVVARAPLANSTSASNPRRLTPVR
jgi:hypothetical protein